MLFPKTSQATSQQPVFLNTGLHLVLVLSAAVLVIVIDVSILRCNRISDTTQWGEDTSEETQSGD